MRQNAPDIHVRRSIAPAVSRAGRARRRATRRAAQKGFTVLDFALYLILASFMFVAQVQQANETADEIIGQEEGQYVLDIANAVNAYVSQEFSSLSIGQPVAGFPSPMQPTVAQLTASNFLESSFTSTSPLGLSYNTTLSIVGTCPGTTCQVNGLTYGTAAYTPGGKQRQDVLANAVSTIGDDGAVSISGTPGPGTFFGQGGWTAANPTGLAGVLAARVGSNSGLGALLLPFYKLDGSRALTGTMNANEQNIENVNELSATTVDATGSVTGGSLVSENGGQSTTIQNSGGTTTVTQTGGVQFMTGSSTYAQVTGGVILTMAKVAPETGCTTPGGLAQNADGSGQLLQCYFGQWMPPGGNDLWMGHYPITASGQTVPTTTCPSGGTPEIEVSLASLYVDPTAVLNVVATPIAGGWVVDFTDGTGAIVPPPPGDTSGVVSPSAIAAVFCAY